MNRQQRRAQERKQRQEDAQKAAQAARQYQKDTKQLGTFDAPKALHDPYYMEQVKKARAEERRNWSRNGITEEDLKQAREAGYKEGQLDTARYYMKMFYAAAGLAVRRLFGFGQTRIVRLLEEMHRVMSEEICTDDIIQRLEDETGLKVNLDDEVGGGINE